MPVGRGAQRRGVAVHDGPPPASDGFPGGRVPPAATFAAAVALAAGALLATAPDARGATVSGRVTLTPGGAAVSGRTVSATRAIAIPTSAGPGDSIPVEWNATTDGNGYYSITVSDALSGLDSVFVYTRSTLHFNELYGGIETSAHTPRVADVGRPGVVPVDLRANVSGVDFVVASNRSDFMVLMQDGATRLATSVYRPARTGAWPVILIRTTYNKEGLQPGQPDFFIPNDYAVVTQDVRGRYASQGTWKPFRDDGWGPNQDGYDTVEWVASRTWSNGRIGTYGGSALGIVQYMAAGAAPPHLTCAWATVAMPVAYHQMSFQGGSYRKELVDGWLDSQGGSYMKEEYRQHPNEDAYWDLQNLFTRLEQVRTPIYHLGGWYDIFGEGTVQAFSVLQDQAAAGARWNQKLRIGPWTHGTVGLNIAGEAVYPLNAIDTDAQAADTIRWFDFWLKGKDTGIMDEPPSRTYVMGAEGLYSSAPGNFWRRSAAWPPPATPRKYYLQRHGGLSTAMPASSGGSDAFTYDPLSPVPTHGGPNLTIPAGPYDQASVEGRADVLVFTSDALASPVEVSGNIRAHLFGSSSATDTDWTVKLVDVYPGGMALSVTDGVLRARHHLAFDSESLLVPGQVYEFVVDLWSTSLIFNTGHRIRIEVSSSNDPRFDPNPNTGHPFRADTQTQVATNRIYHDASRASYLLLPVVETDAAAGCPATSSVSGLRLEKLAGAEIRFLWEPVAGDPCLGEYRLFGSDDPTSWSWFVRNPMARTGGTEVALESALGYYLVIAAGSDGGNGPHWPSE